MNTELEIFDDFVDDLLNSDVHLLKYELDFLLLQYVFKSIDLEVLKKIEYHRDFYIAS